LALACQICGDLGIGSLYLPGVTYTVCQQVAVALQQVSSAGFCGTSSHVPVAVAELFESKSSQQHQAWTLFQPKCQDYWTLLQ
jgi:hypothetical protein